MAATDSGEVEILQEEVDEDYEPTDKEIREYADWLGINADEDPDLLWISRRGLMTPLPKPWRPCQSGDGEIFYFNPDTGENTWDHPCDEELRQLYASEQAKKRKKLGEGGRENSSSDRASDTSPSAATEKSSSKHTPPRLPPTPPAAPPPSQTVASSNQPAATSTEPESTKSSEPTSYRDFGKKLAPLGLLGPLPPLAPPHAGSTSDDLCTPSTQSSSSAQDGSVPPSSKPPTPASSLDDLFDMPLELGSSAGDSSKGTSPVSASGPSESTFRCPPPCLPTASSDRADLKIAPLSPGDDGDALSPIPATAGGDFLSPIAATQESPSPDHAPAVQATGIRELSPCTSSASNSPDSGPLAAAPETAAAPTPLPPAPPSLAASPPAPPSTIASSAAQPPPPPQSEKERGAAKEDDTSGVTARLCRELEQLRSEMAKEKALHKEQQETERAKLNASLSALTQELQNEAAECRRWKAEKHAKDETLESMRAANAAHLAAQARVAADLDTELAAVRAELAQATAAALANAAAAEAATRQSLQSQSKTDTSAPSQDPTQLLPSDALSPPTPELVCILEAELRHSASSQAPPKEIPALASGNDGQEQPSLWSQLEEDKENEASPGDVNGDGASSSLNVSSLSNVMLDHSPDDVSPFDPQSCSPLCGPCVKDGSPAQDDWSRSKDDRGSSANSVNKRSLSEKMPSDTFVDKALPGAKAAAVLKAKSNDCNNDQPKCVQDQAAAEELNTLRAELRELRAELRESRTSSTRNAERSPRCSKQRTSPPTPRHPVDEAEAEICHDALASTVTAGSSHRLESASTCPTMRLQQGVTSLPGSTSAASTLTGPGQMQGVDMVSTSAEHGSGGGGLGAADKSEQLRLQLQALAAARAQGSAANFDATMEPLPEATSAWAASDAARARQVAAAEERTLRAQRETRETRHRLDSAEAEIERLSWELQQWREDADDTGRLLRDTRAALHKEQASHVAAKALVRETQREVQRLTSHFKSHETEGELVASEVQRVRAELADQEAEKQRLQLQLQAREAELGQLRHRRKAQTQLNEADWRQQQLALTEREEALGGRERYLDQREQLAGDAEAMLRQQRRMLRAEVERAELAGLRATVTEFSTPLIVGPASAWQSRTSSAPVLTVGTTGQRTRSAGRRGAQAKPSGRGDSCWPICSSDESFAPKDFGCPVEVDKLDPDAPTPSSSSGTSPNGPEAASTVPLTVDPLSYDPTSEEIKEPVAVRRDELQGDSLRKLSEANDAAANRCSEGPRSARAAAAAAAGEMPEFLRNWRKELRREHAALEEDREMWRCEARRVKQRSESNQSGTTMAEGSPELEVLAQIRSTLDSRAAVLNTSIGEYRALEKLHSSGSSRRSSSQKAHIGPGSRVPSSSRRRSSSTSAVRSQLTGNAGLGDGTGSLGGLGLSNKAGTHEEDLRRRWQHMLQPQQGSMRNIPLQTSSALRAGVGGA